VYIEFIRCITDHNLTLWTF